MEIDSEERRQNEEHRGYCIQNRQEGLQRPWGLASTLQKPESGPVGFLRPNYSSGTCGSLRAARRGLRAAPMTPLSTHGVKQETDEQQERAVQPQTHPLTRGQPDVAGISDFTLTHPQQVRKLTALFIPDERGRLSHSVPRVPVCLLSFVGNISGPVLWPHTVSGTKAPSQIKEEPGSCSGSTFFPQDKQLYPQLYEFLPYSYLRSFFFFNSALSLMIY